MVVAHRPVTPFSRQVSRDQTPKIQVPKIQISHELYCNWLAIYFNGLPAVISSNYIYCLGSSTAFQIQVVNVPTFRSTGDPLSNLHDRLLLKVIYELYRNPFGPLYFI